jgi:hypothetical protein
MTKVLFVRIVGVLLAAVLALSWTAGVASGSQAGFDRVAQTDQLVFGVSMAAFLSARQSTVGGTELDWSSDGCSVGPIAEPSRSQPRGYDFRAACWRHDFGYRNYKRQNRLTEAARQRIDDRFHRDMYDVCDQYTGWRSVRGVECRRIADVFYAVVRTCGQNPAPLCPSQIPGLLRIFA